MCDFWVSLPEHTGLNTEVLFLPASTPQPRLKRLCYGVVPCDVAEPVVACHVPSNGKVEGPHDHAGQAPRAHTVPRRPRRQTAHASRTPPTIVRCRCVLI